MLPSLPEAQKPVLVLIFNPRVEFAQIMSHDCKKDCRLLDIVL